MSTVTLEVSQSIATITFNRPHTLNAITHEDYTAFSEALRAVDKRDDVVVTIWQATGRWFCAGTDVTLTFLGHFDFIYCMPNAWLCVPFTFLGIIAEACSSVNFVERMGVSKAKEALIFGKKIDANALLSCGFVNEIFAEQSVESFHANVRSRLQSELEGLDTDAVLIVKSLLKTAATERNSLDGAILRESMAQAARFATGVPLERFKRIANKEIKHKL
ncbi:hypothetical protein EUX98_g2077 [Antrodiella citrinella]|uniref:Enoyl-CoA hydratase/isomerase domain-containing protein n=1 Tax=Antrodiella citrinella TaxID=2447956 RepID=A0A4S4MZY4_9APHY|nr:hypothetical protein EUX98_g2077 [Antrodiella citrinella]